MVWHLLVTNKIRVFFWKLLNNGLPIGEAINCRLLHVEGLCFRCRASETLDHLFLHCPWAHTIWSRSTLSIRTESVALWKARNSWLLNVNFGPIKKLCNKLSLIIMSSISAPTLLRHHRKTIPYCRGPPTQPQWEPPPTPIMKLNFDGEFDKARKCDA
ncbi:conserved hypothetical protein [Ricinus communis]|uniref:Reverse transcriptase zinc-binding domain-containing protein n=1 Tax=Ricinus communis TaxID=3988 RepID=B9SQ79_RICCO|nr:conserved hypothetical protein [Ricinus communis]